MKYFLQLASFLIIVGSIAFCGCKKDTTPATQTTTTAPPKTIVDTDISAAEDDVSATFIMNDAKVISDASVKNQDFYGPFKKGKILLSGCEVITWANDTTSSDTCYVNFGSSDCVCIDGRKRRGEIIVYWPKSAGTYAEAYSDSANTITMTFKNYYLNDINAAGIRSLTNQGHDTLGYQSWNSTANIAFTYPTGHTATWIATYSGIIVQVNGVWYYEITGSANGVDHNGITYARTITSPLYLTMQPWYWGGCPLIESGVTVINRANSANTLSVNYGLLGTCADVVKASLQGNTYTFSTPW
jgi:hypothetical protein